MASDWMPGADRDAVSGGTMEGQPWRSVVFHTSESGNDSGAIRGVADWVKRQSSEYHLLWNPWHGQYLQLIAASQSARALRNASSSYRTNRKGTRLIQVCIIGRTADKPLAGGSPLEGWPDLLAWLDSHQIPHTDRTGSRSRALWEKSGVHRHADAPGNDHTDPGPIDFDLLYGQLPDLLEAENMRLIEAPDRGCALWGAGYWKQLTDEQRSVALGQGIPIKRGNAREFDVSRAIATQGVVAEHG